MTFNLQQVERQSVQDLPKVNKESGATESSFFSWSEQRGPILPRWGTRERERWLRQYDRHEHNTLWQGASSGLIKKIKATPYELKGGRNLTHRFADVLMNAQFGAGWGTFLSLMLRDYLRYDGGAYAEIIAPGNPLRAPTGAVTGIAHLDSFYCIPTGDPEYPVVYYSRSGKIHVMHHTRILHLVDMPDGDQNHPGYGLCAQSRAIGVIERQLLMNRYIVQSLDDKPSPGFVIANNMNSQERDRAIAVFRGEQSNDIPPEWGRVVWFFNMKPDVKATLENVSFSRPPDSFDYPVYVNLDINELALAIGIDKQEIWELSGATGTAGQSIIQAEKSEGKAPGEIRASLEREINSKLLPESLEFQWKVRDGRAAQQDATTAQIWVGIGNSLAPLIGRQLAAEIVANNVEAVADALFDENGQMIRLPDADERDPNQPDEQVTAEDAAPNDPTNPQQAETTADDAAPARKDYDATRAQFITDLSDLARAGLADELSRRRAGTVMRAQLSRLGRQAYDDGLKAGGVEDGMSDADRAAFAVWLAQQNAYVAPFLDSLYKTGLSEAEVSAHAEMWANKSLAEAYQQGLASADGNGMYEWALGLTDLHCPTCAGMNGQKHRLDEYIARRITPGNINLACKGYNCRCSLQKTTGRARGNWA